MPVWPGYNDSEAELRKLKKAFQEIQPDRIQLNTLDRPGRKKNLKAATTHELTSILNYWQLNNVEIIAKVKKREQLTSYRSDMENAILGTIARRPCTADDLAQILGTHVNEINKYLSVLAEKQKIKQTRQKRGIIYSPSK